MPAFYRCSDIATETIVDGSTTNYAYILCNPGDLVILDSDDLTVNVINPNEAPFDWTLIEAGIATDLFIAGFILIIAPWAAAYGAAKILELLR